jgi:hypothetical protein
MVASARAFSIRTGWNAESRLNRKLDSFQHPDAWITLGR